MTILAAEVTSMVGVAKFIGQMVVRVRLADGSQRNVDVPERLSKYCPPKVGDFFVIHHDGRSTFIQRAEFLRMYDVTGDNVLSAGDTPL